MLSTPGGQQLVLRLVARIALGVLLVSACAPLSGAEPEASPRKPNQPQTEASAKHLQEVLRSRVTLKLGPAPLKDVLEQVAAKYDIKIEQKYQDAKFGETPVTFNADGDRLWYAFRKLQTDSFRKPQGEGRISCTLDGDRLVVEQVSPADAAAWAWLHRRITRKWKKTPLETVLREISEQEQIDIRLEGTVADAERTSKITYTATDTPLHQVYHQILEPLGLEMHVLEGRMTVRPWPIASESPDPKIARTLQEPTHFEFLDVPLKQVLKTLASQHRVKIVLDLPANTDVPPDTPITVFSDDVEGYLADTTLRGAFYRILVPLQLAVELRDGVFYVVEDVGH